MEDLTKDDFSCWGNGDKYDDELFISHDPKITAVEIADQILKNQKMCKYYQKFDTELDMLKVLEDAEKYDKHMRDQHSCGTGEIEFQKVFEIVELLKKEWDRINVDTDAIEDCLAFCLFYKKILDGKK